MVKSSQSEATSRQSAAASPQTAAASSQPGAASPKVRAASPQAGVPSPQVGAASSQPGAASPQVGAPSSQPGAASPQVGATSSQPGAASPQVGGASPQPGAASDQDVMLTPKKVEYLVSVRPAGNLSPAARTLSVLDALNAMPDVEIVGSIKPSGSVVFSTGPGANSGDVIVARTTQERGLALQASAAATPDLIVEPNHRLIHLANLTPQLAGLPPTGLSAVPTTTVQFKVFDEKSQALEKALVVMYGSGFPVNAQTDAAGMATLPLSGTIDSVQAIYVKPFANYWERFIWNPALNGSGVNTVSLQPLASFQPAAFSRTPFLGWGQRLMGLDQQTATGLTGQGIRIGIIDSGCDNKHPALTHIQIGRDYTNPDAAGNPNQQSWTIDSMSHGTHCAGVIAGNGQNGIRGFAPAAEVHILKLFEGGAFDSLIRALKYAIDNQIHVINCSLGSDQSSELVQSWMEQARQAGVAVVVAAGNSAGPVQFPASLPGVLSVSAIGQQGDFPADTYHAQTIMPHMIGVNGVFAAKFTCFGPQVKVCGPGVAIISSVPGGGYAAWDGTSMAAPHLTGLTALIAAHHPAFANGAAPRNAAWVDRLFQTVIAAASPVGINSSYAGAGLPSAVAAFQQPALGQQAAAAPQAPIWQQQMAANQPTSSLENIVRQAVTAALAGIVSGQATRQQFR
jgi:subtilisin